MVAGDSSEDEEGWRVRESYCIDHRAAFDMHEIIDDIFMRATNKPKFLFIDMINKAGNLRWGMEGIEPTDFMHDSGLRMDEDHVGKQKDL